LQLLYCSLAVYLGPLLFSASYYLPCPGTASGAPYRMSACIDYQSAIRTSCGRGLLRHGLNFSTTYCTTRLISGKKDSNHVSTQKVVTLSTCCDVACLTFQLTHITTGSFRSHQFQPTIGSFQRHQHLKECSKFSARWKSFAFHKLVWWHFQVGWASRLQFVLFCFRAVHNISLRRQRRTEPRPEITRTIIW